MRVFFLCCKKEKLFRFCEYGLAFNVQRVAKKCLNKKYFSPKFHHKCILKTKKLIKISGKKLLWNF